MHPILAPSPIDSAWILYHVFGIPNQFLESGKYPLPSSWPKPKPCFQFLASLFPPRFQGKYGFSFGDKWFRFWIWSSAQNKGLGYIFAFFGIILARQFSIQFFSCPAQSQPATAQPMQLDFPFLNRVVLSGLSEECCLEQEGARWGMGIGVVPTTPDPNTSATVSRHKRGPTRTQIGYEFFTCKQEDSILCSSIATETRGVPRHFSKVSGSKFDVTVSRKRRTKSGQLFPSHSNFRGNLVLLVGKKSRSSKDGSRQPPEFCGTFGVLQEGFCGWVRAVENLLKNPHTEAQRFCRTLGAKPIFSDSPLLLPTTDFCEKNRRLSQISCSWHCFQAKENKSSHLLKGLCDRRQSMRKTSSRHFPCRAFVLLLANCEVFLGAPNHVFSKVTDSPKHTRRKFPTALQRLLT